MCPEIADQLFASSWWFKIVSQIQFPVFILWDKSNTCIWQGHFLVAAEFAWTQTELDPLSYSYNKVDAGAIWLHYLSHYSRSSYTQIKNI